MLFKKKEKEGPIEQVIAGVPTDYRTVMAKEEMTKPKKEPRVDWLFIFIVSVFGLLIIMVAFLYPTQISEGFYTLLSQIDQFLWTPLTLFPVWSGILIIFLVWIFGDLFKRVVIVNGDKIWYTSKFEEDGVIYFKELRFLGRKKIGIAKEYLAHNGAMYFTLIKGERMWDSRDPTVEVYQTEKYTEVTMIRQQRLMINAIEKQNEILRYYIEHNIHPNTAELERLYFLGKGGPKEGEK